ncbi:ornithine carbamoyltransferase [Candidatus Poriferisocius sp.]|uniref:ornithine carbamoyltransferase n=1 Tax=Candidatus Poriferisocius sp. TaxID=3101276 RepID=UPI003B5BF5AF
MTAVRHFLDVDDLSAAELTEVLDLSAHTTLAQVLAGKGMALLFEKPSARTRHSMEMAVVQLGGHPVTVAAAEVGIDQRESAEDVAQTLACFHAAIGARVKSHRLLERMAAVSSVPVVNMLSDQAHPLQALADLLTVKQEFGEISGRRIAFVGDANNVSRSLAIGAGLAGAQFVISSPPGYQFNGVDLDRISATGTVAEVVDDPVYAVAGAHVVYTDVWVSMGEEAQASEKIDAFAGRYSVNEALMGQADADAIFLHCLPANPGQEASEEVLYGPQSRIWQQAENRMHAARGLLAFLLEAS